MDAEKLADWLTERLTSDQGKDDFRELAAAAFDGLMAMPLCQVVPEASFSRGLDAALDERLTVGASRAAGPLVFEPLAEALLEEENGLGQWLDEASLERLEAIVARPGLIEDDWIDVLFSQTATEQLFADTLFRALEDFSEAVPRIVQDMTPAALSRFASKLTGATGGVRDKLQQEVGRRLEPEIRRFVEAATRRLLDGAAAFLKGMVDGEAAQQARRNITRYALERPMKKYAAKVDEPLRSELALVSEATMRSEEVRQALKRFLISIHRRWLLRAGDRSLADLLRDHEAEISFDVDAFTDAVWPAVTAGLTLPGAKNVLERLSGEILSYIGSAASGTE